MRTTLRTTALAAALLGSFTLAGCGGDDTSDEPTSAFARQTAAQISAAARSDMAGLRSVTIAGEAEGLDFTVSLADDGTCAGTIEQYGGTAEVIETAEGSYVRGDDDYWLGQAKTPADKTKIEKSLEVWDGRWVKSPRGGGYFLPQCDFEHFIPLLTSGDRKLAGKGDEDEVAGVRAVPLTADQGGVHSTMWVAVDAPHRVVRLSESGEEAATFTFSDYDEPVSIQTPDPAEVYDLAAANKKKAE